MKGIRTNHLNTGKAFERELEITFAAYETQKLATLRKVDPPTRSIGGGSSPKRVFHLPNPFLDFVGTWTERGGRALFLEAKSTQDPRLPLGRSGGITEKQVENLLMWARAGAVSCLIWHVAGETRVLGAGNVGWAVEQGKKSLVPADGGLVTRGMGSVLWDVLAVLRANPMV